MARRVDEYIYDMTNKHRESAGQWPLERVPELDAAARAHSKDMAKRNYLSHETLGTGADPTDRAKAAGWNYGGVGENCHNIHHGWYKNPKQLARLLVDGKGRQIGWMGSWGHRENILRSGYGSIGIGVAFNDKGDVYATQNFC